VPWSWPSATIITSGSGSMAIADPPLGIVLDAVRMPRHVAIIMDGNRRWAKKHRMPVIEGHRRGIVALREITRAASAWGIPLLTVFGFSTENWKRDSTEISLLLDLCVYFAENELAELHRNNVRVRVIGRYELLPGPSRQALDRLQERTAANTGLVLNLAVNYSGRAEVRDAVQALAHDVQAGTVVPGAHRIVLVHIAHAGSRHPHPPRRRVAAVKFFALPGSVYRVGDE